MHSTALPSHLVLYFQSLTLKLGADYTAPIFSDKQELPFRGFFFSFFLPRAFVLDHLRRVLLFFALFFSCCNNCAVRGCWGSLFFEVRPSELVSTLVTALGLLLGSLLALVGAAVALTSMFGSLGDTLICCCSVVSAFACGFDSALVSAFALAFAFGLAFAFAFALGFALALFLQL